MFVRSVLEESVALRQGDRNGSTLLFLNGIGLPIYFLGNYITLYWTKFGCWDLPPETLYYDWIKDEPTMNDGWAYMMYRL